MPAFEIPEAPRWRRLGLWAVRAVLAAVFAAAGGANLAGAQPMVEAFGRSASGNGSAI